MNQGARHWALSWYSHAPGSSPVALYTENVFCPLSYPCTRAPGGLNPCRGVVETQTKALKHKVTREHYSKHTETQVRGSVCTYDKHYLSRNGTPTSVPVCLGFWYVSFYGRCSSAPTVLRASHTTGHTIVSGGAL